MMVTGNPMIFLMMKMEMVVNIFLIDVALEIFRID